MSLTHQQIDRRSLAFDRIIVYLIDHPEKKALKLARARVERWMRESPERLCNQMWDEILQKPWKEIRKYMLTQSDQMQFLRQASPFAGEVCIPNEIRMRIIKKSYEKAKREKLLKQKN